VFHGSPTLAQLGDQLWSQLWSSWKMQVAPICQVGMQIGLWSPICIPTLIPTLPFNFESSTPNFIACALSCHHPLQPCEQDAKSQESSHDHNLLRHSFYFYLYFEHLNFTWSYLIDMKISWSLDHIDLILTILSWRSYLDDLILAILSRRSTILSWSLDLIIRWWSKIHFFYFITYMHLTCLWLMSFIYDW